MTSRNDGGSVTAEMAVGLPVLVVLLCVGLTAIVAVTDQLRCQDAAREVALAAARGAADASASGRSMAPRNAVIHVQTRGDRVQVEVSAVVRPLGGWIPGPTVHGAAVATREVGEP